jgi:hypothetical protein
MHFNFNYLACFLMGPLYRRKIHSEKTFVTPASLINYDTGKLLMPCHLCMFVRFFFMIRTKPLGGFVLHQSPPYVVVPKQNHED